MSYCNFEIHDEIINEYGHIYFPFCLNGINDYVRNNRGEPCCYEMEMIFYNDKYVCNGRGPVHGYKNASDFTIMKMVTKLKRRVLIKESIQAMK